MNKQRTGIAVLILALLVGRAGAVELYVAPAGDDNNPGTKEKPLAGLAAARDAARAFRGKPVTIYLREGTYYLPEPLVLTAADSGTADAPLTIASMPGEKAVISGGRRLGLEWTPYRDGIMRADVPAGLAADELFVNGQRQHMARFPNFDPDAKYFNGVAAQSTSPQRARQWSDPAGGYVHAMHHFLWGSLHWEITGKTSDGKLEMVGGWQHNNAHALAAHKQYRFVENVFEELDAPGEWYLDAGKRLLYFYPAKGLDLDSADVEAAVLTHLIEFHGDQDRPVKHVVLKDLAFTHAARTFMQNKESLVGSGWTIYRGGALFLDGAEDCVIRDCVISKVGGNAVFVSGYNRRIAVVGCHIYDAGASGVCIVGHARALRSPMYLSDKESGRTLENMDKTPGPKTEDYPADCRVENCLIHRFGLVEVQTAGVNIGMAESVTVRHCSVYDCPRAGINICDGAFGGHLIEYNDVFNTVRTSSDHGAFNSWGRDRFWERSRGKTAEWVRQYPDMPKWDCRKTNVLRNNRWRCDHGWDIDLDDGASNYEIYNNLCLAGGIKLREGYFRNVHNNILVNYTMCPHVWYPDCHTTFMRNIIWQDSYGSAGMGRTDQGDTIDYNLVHKTAAMRERETPAGKRRKARDPLWGLLEGDSDASGGVPTLDGELGVPDVPVAPAEKPKAPAASSATLALDGRTPAVKLAKWGGDKHSIVADAKFVDPLAGDYRVKDGSPALDLGFKNFPMERFGVEKPELKAIAKTAPLPGTLAAASIRSGGWRRPYRLPDSATWLGATLKNIENAGEMSAVGLGKADGVLVVNVPKGSEAAAMGLCENDVILAVNGRRIKSLSEFSRIYRDAQADGPVKLGIWRNHSPVSVNAGRVGK